MAEGIVNGFEPIEVADKQKSRLQIAPSHFKLLDGCGEKSAAVLQACQVVAQSEMAQLAFEQGVLYRVTNRRLNGDAKGLRFGVA